MWKREQQWQKGSRGKDAVVLEKPLMARRFYVTIYRFVVGPKGVFYLKLYEHRYCDFITKLKYATEST